MEVTRLNRKEAIVVGLLLIAIFTGSAFAAPAVQNILITNDPLNIRIVGGSPTLQTNSVDIEVLDIAPGITNTQSGSTLGVFVINSSGGLSINFTSGFSFAPSRGFVQVNRVAVTIVYTLGLTFNTSPTDSFGIMLNGNLANPIVMKLFASGVPVALVGDLPIQHLRPGSNFIDIGLVRGGPNSATAFLYGVRLTVEYTFMG